MEEIVNLPGLARGAAVELWAEELKKVAANILDVNTDPKATREITLKATIQPNEDRTNAMVAPPTRSRRRSPSTRSRASSGSWRRTSPTRRTCSCRS
jgi:hypothetical protein